MTYALKLTSLLFVVSLQAQQIDWNTGIKNKPIINNLPYLNSTSYNFAPQTCNSSNVCAVGGISGASLVAGNNAITMTPVPLGMNGTDSYHAVYVNGGTYPQACLITGGTGTSGQTSGQIIINCAYAATGAFTVGSDSKGIVEALNVAPAYGTVMVPAGTIVNTHYPIIISSTAAFDRSNITLTTPGIQSASITQQTANMNVIQVGDNSHTINNVTVSNFLLGQVGVSNSGYAIDVQRAGLVHLLNHRIDGGQRCTITWAGSTPTGSSCSGGSLWAAVRFHSCLYCQFYDGYVQGTLNKGIVVDGEAGNNSSEVRVERSWVITTGGDGLYTGDYSGGVFFTGNHLWGQQNSWAINFNNSNVEQDCCMKAINNEISTNEGDGSWQARMIHATQYAGGIEVNGITGGYASHLTTTGAAVLIDPNAAMSISNFQCQTNGQPCVDNQGSIGLTGSNFSTALSTVILGTSEATATRTHVTGNVFSFGMTAWNVQGGATNTNISGNTLIGMHQFGTNGSPNLTCGGAQVTTYCANNLGVDDLTYQATSGATMNLPAAGKFYQIGGTATVTEMTGGWPGRQVILEFYDSAPGGVATGGAGDGVFAQTLTITSYHTIFCTYFNGAWWCTK